MRDRPRRLNCLLLYNIFSAAEAETVIDHVRSFPRFSRCRVCPVWMLGDLSPAIDLDRFDAVIIHYSIKVHYDHFVSPPTRARIAAFGGLKILFAQDEYYKVNLMNEVVRDLGIHAVFSVSPESEMHKIYLLGKLPQLRRISILTGYVPATLPYLNVKPWRERDIDIGYRARKLSAWLGERGQEKWRIGERVQRDAARYGLRIDISCQESDRLYGRKWIEFVTNCKAVLGTGSGGSVLDLSGDIQENIVTHETEHPDTPFEVLRDSYLKGLDGAITFDVISPRCFEAASLRTLMILYEGWYSGVLRPWRHYVPLKKDHSNMDEVVAVLRDEKWALGIIDNAYREVALNPNYSFAAMVDAFDRVVDEMFRPAMRARKMRMLTGYYPVVGLVRRLRWHHETNRGTRTSLLQDLFKQSLWRWRLSLEAWFGRRTGRGEFEVACCRRRRLGRNVDPPTDRQRAPRLGSGQSG